MINDSTNLINKLLDRISVVLETLQEENPDASCNRICEFITSNVLEYFSTMASEDAIISFLAGRRVRNYDNDKLEQFIARINNLASMTYNKDQIMEGLKESEWDYVADDESRTSMDFNDEMHWIVHDEADYDHMIGKIADINNRNVDYQTEHDYFVHLSCDDSGWDYWKDEFEKGNPNYILITIYFYKEIYTSEERESIIQDCDYGVFNANKLDTTDDDIEWDKEKRISLWKEWSGAK